MNDRGQCLDLLPARVRHGRVPRPYFTREPRFRYTFGRVMTTGVVNQDLPHDPSGDAKEMRPVPPIDLASIDKSQIRLVAECCRL